MPDTLSIRLEAAEHGRLLDRFRDRVTEGLPGSDAELMGRRVVVAPAS